MSRWGSVGRPSALEALHLKSSEQKDRDLYDLLRYKTHGCTEPRTLSPLSSRNILCITKITLGPRWVGQPNAQ